MRGLLSKKDLNKLTLMIGRKYLDISHSSKQYYTELKKKILNPDYIKIE